jgi:hypothetical protein
MPRDSVFLNVPYDSQYSKLYLAQIAGLCAFGLEPRATLEVPNGDRRLDRIFDLLTNCRYSLHDLSRVELDLTAPRTPRFNMPFELGLLLGWRKSHPRRVHTWFVFESKLRRLQKSLSDLNGTDPLIHGGTVRGVFRELSNAFTKGRYNPTIAHMTEIYRHIDTASPAVMRLAGADSLFSARVFKDLVVLATSKAELTVPRD